MELQEKELTHAIIGAAMEVHRELGHGFLEPVYYEPFEIELSGRGITFQFEPSLRIRYKMHVLKKTYEPDYLVQGRVVVELKALDQIGPNEEAQLLNYLKATGLKVGLLINFGARSLQWKRMVL